MFNGSAESGGCALIADSSPTFTNCVFQRCRSTGAAMGNGGGAVYIQGAASPLFRGTDFIDAYSSTHGGCLYITAGNVTVDDSRFTNCTTVRQLGYGGAVFFNGAGPSYFRDINVTNCK